MPEYEVPNATVATLPTGLLLLRLVISLGLVVGLIFLTGWIWRRLGGRPRGGYGKKIAEVLEVVPLGSGRALYVVELGSRALLLSGTTQAVSLLYEVPLAEVQPALPEAATGEEVSPVVENMLTRLRAVREGAASWGAAGSPEKERKAERGREGFWGTLGRADGGRG